MTRSGHGSQPPDATSSTRGAWGFLDEMTRRSRRTSVRTMTAVISSSLLALLLLAGAPASDALPLTPAPAPMDAILRAALPSNGVVRGVAVLGAPALPVQLSALRGVGLAATPYVNLPMVALQGPAAAFVAAGQLPFVRSLWGDHALEATLEQSTTMIQADDVYSPTTCGCGVAGFTGRGVRIAILDSGIDATHPDLALGTKTVQNVKVLGYDKIFGSSLLTL